MAAHPLPHCRVSMREPQFSGQIIATLPSRFLTIGRVASNIPLVIEV
jgi:hypothetical protein